MCDVEERDPKKVMPS